MEQSRYQSDRSLQVLSVNVKTKQMNVTELFVSGSSFISTSWGDDVLTSKKFLKMSKLSIRKAESDINQMFNVHSYVIMLRVNIFNIDFYSVVNTKSRRRHLRYTSIITLNILLCLIVSSGCLSQKYFLQKNPQVWRLRETLKKFDPEPENLWCNAERTSIINWSNET